MKTHLLTKKRALISSVAMLLVAIIALGTATFAWFTKSTSATANNINVQTTKSSELQVSKHDLDWTESVDYGMANAKTLRPVTSADGSNWYSSFAADKDEFTSNGTYTLQTGNSLDNYVFSDVLNIRNKGGQTCSRVKVAIESTVNSEFARIALVPCENHQTEAGLDKMPAFTKDNFKANIYGAAANRTWKPYNGTNLEDVDYKTAAAANGKVVEVGDIAPNAVVSYRVLVWFEGEDAKCFDTTDSGLTVPNVKFTVTGETANQHG